MSIFGERLDDENVRKIIQPVTFLEPGTRETPIHNMKNEINETNNFAITKFTEGGKYVRGKMLFFKLNGVEIYTDVNNIIFVDKLNSTMFVREYDKVLSEINPNNPENIQYILLYTDLGYEDGEEDFPLRWESVVGRMQAYEAIKLNAPVIDVDKSFILSETISFKDCLSIRQFCEWLKNSDIVQDEAFDISDFAGSEYQ